MSLALWQVAVETASRSVTDNSLVIGACITAVGVAMLWFARVILGTRDDVRDIRTVLLDARTGLVPQVDGLERRMGVAERRMDTYERAE